MIHRLHNEVSNLSVRTVLELCSERPGVWVSIRDVERAAGVSMPTVRAGMAGLTMFLKARFQASNWPLDWQFTQGAVHYRMSPEVAGWWRERTP